MLVMSARALMTSIIEGLAATLSTVVPTAEPHEETVSPPPLAVTVRPAPAERRFGALPVLERRTFAFTNGYFTVDGKPTFLIGNGCDLGAAQASPTGLWLAKMQGVGFIALEAGINLSAGNVADGAVSISPTLAAGNVSWLRECRRLGFLTEAAMGHGPFVWSPLKALSKAHPDFAEIHGDMGHGIAFDANTELGRRLLVEKRSAFLNQIDHDGFICEIGREPGPQPTNRRVRTAFREWAKRKYGTLDEACRTWRRRYSKWEDVLPPHLDDSEMALPGQHLALRKHAKASYPEMYYDWIAFVQKDVQRATANEIGDLRARFPDVPYTIDTRAHQHYSDSYCAYDPAETERLTDVAFIHCGFCAYDYNNTPWHAKTLANETCFPLFAGAYFRSNSAHPIVDAEDIVSTTLLPGSNAEAMERNDIAALHLSPWRFRLEGDGADGLAAGWNAPGIDDAGWGEVKVPGAWDEQEPYKGRSGVGWYRKRFVARANRQDYLDGSRRFLLHGRGVAQRGSVWLNGTKVGDVTGWDSPYSFDVGALLNFGGTNTIVWRVDGSQSQNGLRKFCHILAHDQINASKPFGERQYASLYWTWLMRGLSGVLSWNWNADVLRPHLAQIAKETQFAAETALPQIRFRHGKTAYLYGYLNGYGLPCVSEDRHEPYLNWFNALLFAGVEPDVLGEQTLVARLDPARYPLLVVPHCAYVHDDTLAKIRDYAARGGIVVMTEDSLARTFSRYKPTQPIQGCVIAPSGLSMLEVQKFLMPYLPPPGLKMHCAGEHEIPLIERQLAGGDERKILYLHNWGGLEHRVEVELPPGLAGWHLTSIRGAFSRLPDGRISVMVPSQSPVAAVLARSAPVTQSEFMLPAEKQAEIDRIVALNAEVEPGIADVLFPRCSERHTPVGKELYPNILSLLAKRGLTTASVDPAAWTAEMLANKRVVVFPETKNSFAKVAKKDTFRRLLLDYVERGGSLLFLSHTARTVNTCAPVMEAMGSALGYRRTWALARDPVNCSFGDPYQIVAPVSVGTPFASGVKRVALYDLTPLEPTTGSAAKIVVPVPGGAAMLAVEHGNGRVFVSADNIFCQPYRINEADNARLLDNVMDWLVGQYGF